MRFNLEFELFILNTFNRWTYTVFDSISIFGVLNGINEFGDTPGIEDSPWDGFFQKIAVYAITHYILCTDILYI